VLHAGRVERCALASLVRLSQLEIIALASHPPTATRPMLA